MRKILKTKISLLPSVVTVILQSSLPLKTTHDTRVAFDKAVNLLPPLGSSEVQCY